MSEASDILRKKVSTNEYSITVIQGNKPETQTNIDYFSSPSEKVDTKILSITSQINSLQTQIVGLSTSAYAVGCGTTAGATTLYPDVVRTYTENMSSSTYSGDSPFSSSSALLGSSNIGVGTYLVYSQSDSSQTGIGTLYGTIDTCFRTPCTSGVCVSFAASITTLQSQITTLRTQLTTLVSDSNKIKTERREYQIERYAQNSSIRILGEQNSRINSAITAIETHS